MCAPVRNLQWMHPSPSQLYPTLCAELLGTAIKIHEISQAYTMKYHAVHNWKSCKGRTWSVRSSATTSWKPASLSIWHDKSSSSRAGREFSIPLGTQKKWTKDNVKKLMLRVESSVKKGKLPGHKPLHHGDHTPFVWYTLQIPQMVFQTSCSNH